MFMWTAFVIGIFLPASLEAFTGSGDPVHLISKSFQHIKVQTETNGKQSIEFCPDNTCDFFLARREVSLESLKDFAYIYIYYFSDFYVLEKWRGGKEAAELARHILLKPVYEDCRGEIDEKSARCLLRRLSREDRIELYFVRYDENERNISLVKVIEATATSRLQ
jgi:hypothetical protein